MSNTSPSRALRPAIKDLTSVTHEGKVLVVGAGHDGVLYYTVRQSGFEDTAVDADSMQAMPGFENWRMVPLNGSTDDPSVRAEEAAKLVDGSGNPIMRSRYGSSAALSAAARPKLISGLGHLYLFRVSADNRLLMNRFVLDGMTNELVPKLEVRYRRSEQKLVPEGGTTADGKAGHDTLGYRDPDQNLFYEPTQELSFLGQFEADKPWFSVELTPTAEHERYRWNFFVITDGELRLVSVAASLDGLIDVTDQIKSQPDPDMVDQRVIRTIPGIVDRRLDLPGPVVSAFDSTLYHNQVERKTKAGPQLLKEATRVMLSVPISQAGFDEPVVAAVSFAVNNLGELAQVDRTANSDEILVGNTKEVLLPLADLEDIKLIADRTPPPMGVVTKLSQSADESVAVHTDVALDGVLREGQNIKLSGTKSYDGVYVAKAVDGDSFEIAAVFDPDEKTQGHWEVVEEDESGLVFENMIAGYERTASGGLKITCLSHNITEGDEIEISGSKDHDGIYPIVDVDEDNSFELDQVWPTGEVINLSRRPRRGLAFDGRGDYLKAGPIEFEPNFSNARLERSVSAWVNLSEISSEPQTIFATSSRLIHLFVNADGKATLEVGFSDGHTAKVVDPEPLPTNTWVHLTAMLDYQGETTGDTTLLICRGGIKTAEATVEARKPLHLPLRNLRIKDQALPISTVQYGMNRSDAITMEGWISTRSSGRGVIASWDQNGRFELAVSGTGSSRVVEWATGSHIMQSEGRLSSDRWHHIAGTYNPKTGEKTIHINGELDSTATAEAAADAADRAATEAEFDDAKSIKTPKQLGFLGAGVKRPTVTAENVASVTIPGGSFKQAGPKRWFELDAGGRKVSEQMRETRRADGVVHLQPEGAEGSHRFEIDLDRMVVDRIEYNMAIDQRSITGTQEDANDKPGNYTSVGFSFTVPSPETIAGWQEAAKNPPPLPPPEPAPTPKMPSFSSFGGTIKKVSALMDLGTERIKRVDCDDGYYVQKPEGWQRYDQSGATVGEPMPETSRDLTTIHAANPTTGDRREFNIQHKTINGVDGVGRRKAHDLTGAVSLSKDPATQDRFDGFVADVRIWNRARSTKLIDSNRRKQLTGTERNLIAHWPLSDTEGPQLSDLTKSMAHIDRSAKDTKLAWLLEPHRAPGERTHYEGRTYQESVTMAAALDESDRNMLRLDGSGYLTIPTLNDDLSAGYTITAWARWDSFDYWTRIFEIGNGPDAENILLGNAERTNGLALWTSSPDEAGTPVHARVDAPAALTLGAWTHIAATVDPTGRAMLYVDGANVANGNVRVPDSSRRGTNFVGRGSWPDEPLFNGAIRDVQFWGRPLEPDEVKYFMNTDAQGTEDGLLHHWPMRTATIKSKKRVVDQGIGQARHGDLVGTATVEQEAVPERPVALTELRGKLSDVQLWNVNRPVETVRKTMHDQLTGNEYGLVGYWRCGGILEDERPGAVGRVSPDFAAEAHDARVFGDTYVSARDLSRQNSVGKAVKFSNDDLVSVSQRSRYRETFEFRATRYDGEHFTAEELEDVNGQGDLIFEFNYWGRKSRTSEQRVDFRADQTYDFMPMGDGWFQARCDVTIPDGINFIRSFEIDQVTGRWSDEETPPDDEWLSLSIRKHRLELISDSISRRTFGDQLELPTLVENASELEVAIRKIPVLERRLAATKEELTEVLEALLVFSQQEKFQSELNDRKASVTRLTGELDDHVQAYTGYIASPLSYTLMLVSASHRLVLDMPHWGRPYLYVPHRAVNQQWEFEPQTDGSYKLKLVANGQYLLGSDQGQQLTTTSGDGPRTRWKVEARQGHLYSITNVATGLVLDVEYNRPGFTPIISWPYHGGNNQLWELNMAFDRRVGVFADVIKRLYRPIQTKKVSRAAHQARIAKLETFLDDLSDERKTALESRRDALEAEIRTFQDSLNGLNTNYIETAANVTGAQTMALVAEDALGLKTYGAVLGFASPAGGLTSSATAEGNVQLSYFDSQGRMRFSQYDATSDSTNATYEQWLPSTIAVCPDLSNEDSVIALDATDPIELDPVGHTVEAWFYYPLPVTPFGEPYPYAYLTSDASGSQAAIAVANNQRLGVVVDGFFHDSGTDLAVELDHGWHHVAAKTSGDATLFYLDGEPAGHNAAELQNIRRYAMTFDGGPAGSSASSLTLGTMNASDHDYTNGFTVQAWVRWDELAFWSRLIDFASGPSDNNIILANPDTDDTLILFVRNGENFAELSVPHAIQTGVWTNVAATIKDDGLAVVYINGLERARGECLVPPSADRTRNYIGLSNWHDHSGAPDRPFKGAMSSLMVWNRALSVSEIQRFAYAPPAPDSSGLLHHWPMSVRQDGDVLKAEDVASANHASIGASVTNRQLSGRVSAPIAGLGNHLNGGAPAGKLAEVRVWDAALPDEEIRYHSLVQLSGNEPDLRACYRLDDIVGGEQKARDLTGKHKPGAVQRAMPVARTAKIGHPGTVVGRFEAAPGATGTRIPGINLANRSFTVETWIKRERAASDNFFRQGTTTQNQGLHLAIRDKTMVFGFYGDDLGYDFPDVVAAGVNNWIHVCTTYDASSRKMVLYVDGEQVKERTANGSFTGSGDIMVGGLYGSNAADFTGQLSELRIWDHPRTGAQVAAGYNQRATGTESGLLARLSFDDNPPVESVSGQVLDEVGHRGLRSDDLPIVAGPSLVTAEYSTVGVDPQAPDKRRAILRRFIGFADAAGRTGLLPGKRIEELVLKWIGNAQFEPTLLGYMEGAPPVPSENLTINYDYDSATSVELVQSDEVAYSWNRNREVAAGLDINTFLGAAWSVSGGAFIETKLTEGHAGARGTLNTQIRDSRSSMIRASSTDSSRDRLDLRGAFEQTPRFEHLGNRYVPKNVGYALVISGMADVFVTQMKRTGRMVAYEVVPVEDMPPDVNTITFLINPAHTMNGSLDGLVGSHAADPRFYRHVPEMRAQYGSRYPASYFNLRQAYDLKAQIERWDTQRESYFFNFDARETGSSAELTGDIPPAGDRDDYGEVELKDDENDSGSENSEDGEKKEKKDRAKAGNDLKDSYAKKGEGDVKAAKKRRSQIEELFDDADRIVEANTAFDSWQRRIENLQIKAAKRNIFNTYVWDADGGMRFEEQSVANTIEHTIGGTFNVNATLGFDGAIQVGGFKGELQAMATHELSQTMSKTQASTRSFELSVRLDGLERKGITDSDDYPVQPGEKVDRYRFMSFYLEGNTDHFTDFFDYVVDPEWLMSNDEEARALRQVARGRPNKTWRVMHRVTYVERPALMGFGRDLRQAADLEQANQQVFNYFDSLEQDNLALRSQIDDVSEQLTKLAKTVTEVKELAGKPGDDSPGATDSSGGAVGADSAEDQSPPDGGSTADQIAALAGDEPPRFLDVNTATLAELEAVTGIGPAMAKAIVDLRTANGPITSLGQLTDISGIGLSSLLSTDPLLFVDGPGDGVIDEPIDGESVIDLRNGLVAAAGSANGGLLDVNAATAEELIALPGIGPSLAAKIIEHRSKGAFTNLQELSEVSGISPATVTALLPLLKSIAVEPAPSPNGESA